MTLIRLLPLTIIPVLIYNVLFVLLGAADVDAALRVPLFSLTMPSGGAWALTWADLLIFLALAALFVEVIKSTSSSSVVMLEHMIGMAVFIVCLVEFMVVRKASHSIFFLLTIAALVDVVAGYTISMRAARRQIGIGAA
jgi:hypothetical protein